MRRITTVSDKMTIGVLSNRTETSIDTMRYYERMGLLPPVPRSEGGQRRYGDEHFRRLSFIRHGRALGLSLNAIADMVRRVENGHYDCGTLRKVRNHRLSEIEQHIGHLERLREQVRTVLAKCGDADLRNCAALSDWTRDAEGPASGACCASPESHLRQ